MPISVDGPFGQCLHQDASDTKASSIRYADLSLALQAQIKNLYQFDNVTRFSALVHTSDCLFQHAGSVKLPGRSSVVNTMHLHPLYSKRKAQSFRSGLLSSIRWRLVLNLYDLTLVVRSASLADSVRHNKSTTLRTLNKVHLSHLPVRSSRISASLG